MVRQVWCVRDVDDAQLALPYLSWHLLAFDSYFNIMLSRYMEELIRIPTEDLVILVGPIAHEWLNMRQN